MATINRTWFKNRLRNGEFLYKCNGKYSDDYAFDAAYDYFQDKEYAPADPDLFDDWYLRKVYISGDKEGFISVSFASCEFYTFILKTNYNENDEQPIKKSA